ncbi:hypothetical protein SmJEL517_g00048 [Synchytrium microbalum]|uniref:Cleavage stimulation factor 50 kDa subunit n=1 Tax=Synchytrium microbalum TaxID=1806994 RepID=A0A507CJT9_9FUNG|nr:uncharacterized protein SmJEL517_g00048 [Synchytrium microbalum]TPX38043.1 hypothetical protein SmJEL517_g00048 [Synchytrium microbalum]
MDTSDAEQETAPGAVPGSQDANNGAPEQQDAASDAMSKEQVIPLIINQLQSYGLSSLAQVIAEATNTAFSFAPSDRLSQLCSLAVRTEDRSSHDAMVEDEDDDPPAVGGLVMDQSEENPSTTTDANGDPSSSTKQQPKTAPSYMSWYSTPHKAAVLSAAFSVDGKYIATGGADCTVKVLDVAKARRVHTSQNDKPIVGDESSPVSRSVTDHTGNVTDVAFHPNNLVLASCSDDKHIKMYDMQKVHMKRSFRYLQDSHAVNSISFHASGDFLLVATTHEYPRVYDISTFQCYRPSSQSDAHASGINCARYAPQGSMFATCGGDGSIKLYDAINGKCVNTLERAHGGASVSSIVFSKSGRYLLSSGQDSIGRLWDVTMGRPVCTYEGASQKNHSINITFNYNEDIVLSSDESALTVNIWDARTGTALKQLVAGHTDVIPRISTSPVDPCFVSCSHDGRIRFWDITESHPIV